MSPRSILSSGAAAQHGAVADRLDRGDFGSKMQQERFPDLLNESIPAGG